MQFLGKDVLSISGIKVHDRIKKLNLAVKIVYVALILSLKYQDADRNF